MKKRQLNLPKLGDDKFVWRKATQASFDNPTHYGPFYTNKLKLFLDTARVDYPEKIDTKSKETV